MKTIREKIEELVIKIGANGPRFIGEGNMVHTQTLENYVSQIEKLIEEEKDEAYADGVEYALEVTEDEKQT